MNKQLLPLLILLVLLQACASEKKTLPVDPATVTQSYDYTKPVEAAGRSRPVYILPSLSTGWVPATVDENNQWVGGHYVSTVVEPGHWATLEEAEMSGKPYVFAGQGKPVVPVMSRSAGPTGNGPAEFELSQMAGQISEIQKQLPAVRQNDDVEQVLVAGTRSAGSSEIASADIPATQIETTKGLRGLITLTRKPPGTIESIPIFDGKEKATVRYLPDRKVSIEWRGQSSTFEFSNDKQEYDLVR